MAELVDMEVVNVPTMDWAQAAATAIRMGSRIAGRTQVLVTDASGLVLYDSSTLDSRVGPLLDAADSRSDLAHGRVAFAPTQAKSGPLRGP